MINKSQMRHPNTPSPLPRVVVFHEFTCPIMVDDKLVAEIDLGADIIMTYEGHASFFDSNSGAADPGSGIEYEVQEVFFRDLNDPTGIWENTDPYLTKQALDYLHTEDGYDSVCDTIREGR